MGGTVFNTGIIFMASRGATIAFCERWANATLTLTSNEWWSDDQGVFNQLLTGRGAPPPGGGGGTAPRSRTSLPNSWTSSLPSG